MAQHANYWFGTCPTKQTVTSGLIKNVDILIIGGGIAGISLLNQLIKSGFSNTYLVEESSVGFHSTGRGCGQLHLRGSKLFSQMPEQDGIDYLNFIVDNNRRFLHGLRNVDFDTDLRDVGGIRLALDEKELQLLQQEADFINKHADIPCPSLTRDEIANILPDTKFFGGIFIPNEAIFNPYKVVNGMREYIEKKGTRVLTNCQVFSIVKNSEDGFSVHIRHKGTIKTKKIVYCTDSYVSELLPEFNSKIKAIRSQVVATDFLAEDLAQTLPHTSMSCNNNSENWRVHGGKMIISTSRASTRLNQMNTIDDGEVSPSTFERIKSFTNENLPFLKDIKFTHTWCGIISQTYDSMPFIGQVPNKPNEYIFAGFGNYGFSHALHGSTIIKDYISNNETSCTAARLFNPTRILEN